MEEADLLSRRQRPVVLAAHSRTTRIWRRERQTRSSIKLEPVLDNCQRPIALWANCRTRNVLGQAITPQLQMRSGLPLSPVITLCKNLYPMAPSAERLSPTLD